MRKLIINTDGASRGNPGLAAAGFIVTDESGDILLREGVALGVATNNEAEYAAVKNAFLKILLQFPQEFPLEVELRSDSMLVVNQLAGKYKIKSPHLKIIIAEIKNLEEKVGKASYLYIPRSQNSAADQLVNEILDQDQ